LSNVINEKIISGKKHSFVLLDERVDLKTVEETLLGK
jgi:hypothetical protein